MAKHWTSLVLVVVISAFFSTTPQAQNQPTPPKAPLLDQPPVLNRVFPPALTTGKASSLELRGTGVENPLEILASRRGFGFKIIPQEIPPPPAKPGSRPATQPMNQPSRLVGRVEATSPITAGDEMVELRVLTAGGLSNSRKILLTSLSVVEEKEPNNDPDSAHKLNLNQIAAGVISSTTDVDYYQFEGSKGQRLLAWMGTATIDSRLPGAVEIIGPDNRVLAQARDRVDSDTVLDLRLPTDGTYKARIFGFGHVESGPDAFYLLRLGESPVIDSVHPLVQSPSGGDCLVFGHGLPGGTPVPGRKDGLEQAKLALRPVSEESTPATAVDNPNGLLPLKPFRFAGGPAIWLPVSDKVTMEPDDKSDNNSPDKATPILVPAVVSARLEKPGDRDFFRFDAKKGEPLSIELLGDRVGTRLDFVLSLKSDDDKKTQEFDDGPEALHPQWFFNRTDDPTLRFTPPRDGTYRLSVSARDVNLGGSPQQVYALRVGPPRPDFRLVTIDPTTQGGIPRLKPGTALSFLVLAERLGGFDSPIEVRIDRLPPGTLALPCQIPAGQKGAWLTLIGEQGMTEAAWPLNVTGSAKPAAGANTIERQARHAAPAYPSTQQVNNPQPVRMEHDLLVATSPNPPLLTLTPDQTTIKLTQGDRATVKFTVKKPQGMTGQGQVTLMETQNQPDPPVRVSNGNNGQVTIQADKDSLEFQLECRNNARAQVLHLVPRFTITAQEDDPDNKGRRRQVVRMENGPPIEVTLLPKRPLQPTLTSQTIRAKGGEKGTVTIRLNRQGFYGPVRLVCAEYGLDTTVQPDLDEAPLELSIPQNARPGGKPLVIQATCEALPGHTVNQELRLQFNLVSPMARPR